MIQHVEAEKLLRVISDAANSGTLLTYTTAAIALGRDPATNSRMVAQVCDLLDAAAALAGVPLLALTAVREKDGSLNRKAWAGSPHRDAVFECSAKHKFSSSDYEAIVRALAELRGMGNRRAWDYVRELIPSDQLYARITGNGTRLFLDAIDDLGSDSPATVTGLVTSYARDPKVRAAVMRRAGGKCEYCGELGFVSLNGERYLECHHIIALAKDGKDRMTNVIALCANDHRRAHFGDQQNVLEEEMIQKINKLENSG